MITLDDIRLFTEGYCHLLALAIHRKTGWTVCAFLDPCYDYEADLHAFVLLPDGRYLDVRGPEAGDLLWERWCARNGTYDFLEIGPVEDHGEFNRNSWGEFSYSDLDEMAVRERAEEVADLLVQEYYAEVAFSEAVC